MAKAKAQARTGPAEAAPRHLLPGSKTLLPCGVDPGIAGGFGMLCDDNILMAERVCGTKVKLQELEGSHKKLTAKDKRKKRYVDGTLAPSNSRLFNAVVMQDVIQRAVKRARELGFAGIYVAIESPQTLIGKSSPASYLVTGGCFHTWIYVLESNAIKWGCVAPAHWKDGLKLTSDKNLSVAKLIEWLPSAVHVRLSADVRLVDDHNVAEAVLLAHWLRQYCPRRLETTYVPR